MTRFFSVRDNSFHTRGYPWIVRIVTGIEYQGTPCPDCGRIPSPSLTGDVEVKLEKNEANRWPDVVGCGAKSMLIVSERVISAWRMDGIGNIPAGGRVTFLSPLPCPLQCKESPSYLWVNETLLGGARLDMQASGFMGLRFCSRCECYSWDVGATYDRQHCKPWSYVFAKGSWSGAHLFTAPPAHSGEGRGGMLFCTERVVECAKKHRLTNFRFVPIELGDPTSYVGLDYM
jgi:hypothetical protein